MSGIRYRPEIDGIRAIAVIPVVLFHLGLTWLPGGFVGVDVFFVISGFLITSILLKEHDAGGISLKDFWSRRIRRIFPALLVMMAVTLFAGAILLFTPDFRSLGSQALSVLTFGANFKMLKLTGDYWGPAAESIPLLHTWSLAVEEQFYLVYPLLLAGLLRFGRRRTLAVLAMLATVSFIICVARTPGHQPKAFFQPHTRIWELLTGCIGAFVLKNWLLRVGPRVAAGLSCAGLLMIGAACLLFSGSAGFPGFKAMLPVAGALLVILFTEGRSDFVRQTLSHKVLVWIGKLSYSLYLWHWPVIVFAGLWAKTHAVEIPVWSVALVALMFSVFSLEVVERFTRKAPPFRFVATSIAGLALVIAGSVYAGRVRATYDTASVPLVEWAGELYNTDALLAQPVSEVVAERRAGMVVPRREPNPGAAGDFPAVVVRHGETTPSVLVLGDSHGLMWADVINDAGATVHRTVAFHLADGTPPFLGVKKTGSFSETDKRQYDSRRMKDLAEWQPKIVIIVSNWSSHLGDGSALRELCGEIRKVAPGTRILVPEQPPVAGIGDVNALHLAVWRKSHGMAFAEIPRADEAKRLAANKLLAHVVAEFSNTEVVPVGSIYERPSDCVRFADEARLLYIDDDHLSRYGASLSLNIWGKKIAEVSGN